MRTLQLFALVTALVSATACGKKKDNGGTASGTDNGTASGTAGSGTASDNGSAGTGAASGTGTGAASDQPQVNTPPTDAAVAAIDTTGMAHKAGNCPSTVAGATTVVADSADGKGVVVTISSNDKDAIWAIQTRAKHLAEVQDAPDAKVEHTGKGTGGGTGGVCPIVTKDTKVTVEQSADGVKVTLVPTGSLKLDALKADVGERIKKSAALTEQVVKPADAATGARGEAGTGGGAGKHGGNRTGKGDGSGPRNGSGGGSGSNSKNGATKQANGNRM